MTGTGAAVGVDVGGTFTDVALFSDGRLHTAKVPTTEDQSVGVLQGIEKACDAAGLASSDVGEFAHAMTVSVNALLERDGATTALITTEGFRDVLEIGRQDRPALYDLDAEKPDPLIPRHRRFEVDERATPEGIERRIDDQEKRQLAAELDDAGVESVAVSLLHAYATPENERELAATLRETLDVPVSVSHEVLAEFREFERTATTAVDAYVRPTIDSYVGRLVDRVADAGLPAPRIMQANGGVADAETVRQRAVTTVLSGPAAGVVGAAATATQAASGDGPAVNVDGRPQAGLVTFDMGGTSTDVSLVRDGTAERTTDAEIDGVPIRTPMVDITTVGAGGGSLAWIDDGGALRVGPRSAGAQPGPVCYGRGGTEPTVTDANVVLGYIGPDTSLGGELTLDIDAAEEALSDLAQRAGLEDAMAAAQGIYRVANATMTRAIRTVTVDRGHDPRQFDLVAFGGAGPMHAAGLAEGLDVDRVIVPRPAGVLSAFGLLAADEVHDAARTVRISLEEADPGRLDDIYEELEERALEDSSRSKQSATDSPVLERAADCRYAGQSFELTVPVDSGESSVDPEAVAERFQTVHESTYGYTLERASETIEAVTLRATATVPSEEPTVTHAGGDEPELGTRTAQFPGAGRREATVYDRNALPAGETVDGAAILEQAESTTVVPPGWTGTVLEDGALRLEVNK